MGHQATKNSDLWETRSQEGDSYVYLAYFFEGFSAVAQEGQLNRQGGKLPESKKQNWK